MLAPSGPSARTYRKSLAEFFPRLYYSLSVLSTSPVGVLTNASILPISEKNASLGRGFQRSPDFYWQWFSSFLIVFRECAQKAAYTATFRALSRTNCA